MPSYKETVASIKKPIYDHYDPQMGDFEFTTKRNGAYNIFNFLATELILNFFGVSATQKIDFNLGATINNHILKKGNDRVSKITSVDRDSIKKLVPDTDRLVAVLPIKQITPPNQRGTSISVIKNDLKAKSGVLLDTLHDGLQNYIEDKSKPLKAHLEEAIQTNAEKNKKLRPVTAKYISHEKNRKSIATIFSNLIEESLLDVDDGLSFLLNTPEKFNSSILQVAVANSENTGDINNFFKHIEKAIKC